LQMVRMSKKPYETAALKIKLMSETLLIMLVC